MKKLSGRICDSCRTMFNLEGAIYEVCPECFHSVWCITNIYEDGSKELSSIHHTKESAEKWIKDGKCLIKNTTKNIKPIKQQIDQWCVF